MTRMPVMLVALLAVSGAVAAERHTGGRGGGRWTDPATWHGGIAPAGTDTVVVASGDSLVYDGGEGEGLSCAGLMIDPGGDLSVLAGETGHVLRVGGLVESYGRIRIDATRAPRARIGIRVQADAPGDRAIRLHRNGALLVYGHPAAAEPVVTLAACTASGAAAPGTIEAGAGTMLDLSAVRIRDFGVRAEAIDNTGFKPNERLQVAGCRFEGHGRIRLQGCDSPLVSGNRFQWTGEVASPDAAVASASGKLLDVRLNRVSGAWTSGFEFNGETDPAISSNSVEGAAMGYTLQSCANAMLRANGASGCGIGIQLAGTTGAAEDLDLRKSGQAGARLISSRVQMADLRVEGTAEAGAPILLDNSSVTLVNPSVATGDVRRVNTPPGNGEPWVTALYYLVVKAPGVAPGSEVAVQTAAASGGVPAGLADLNVRNSPARILANGLTPLPRTQRPLVVRGWRIEHDGTFKAAPFYDLSVMGPPDPKTGVRPVLKAQVIEPKPGWHRPEPDAPVPTLEVK